MADIFYFFITSIGLLNRVNKPLLVLVSVGLSADPVSLSAPRSHATRPTCLSGRVVHILRQTAFLSPPQARSEENDDAGGGEGVTEGEAGRGGEGSLTDLQTQTEQELASLHTR